MPKTGRAEQVVEASTEGTIEEATAAVEPASAPAFKLRLTKPHRLIQATRDSWASRDPHGYASRNTSKAVDIRASKATRRSALIVMDRFIKGMEAEDLRVEVTDGYQDAGTFACEGRDRIQVHVHEKNKRVKHEPTAKELREKEQFPGTRIPKWEDMPTGELVLTPGGTVDFSSEQALDQFIKKAVVDVIEGLARARKKREEEEAARRHEWECRMEAEHEKERVEAMHQAAGSLHQYRILTDYIEEVRRFGRVPEDQIRVNQSLEEWLAWAEAQARRIHPLGS